MESHRRASVLALFVLGLAASSPSAAAPAPPTPAWTDQGWSKADMEAFWFTPQGSWLVPYRWFLEVEQAGSQARFRDDANLSRLGYITEGASTLNPDALPVGFVKDRQKREGQEMLGLTCAACHTSRVELGTQVVQIEGGPSLADFESLLTGLVAALEATLADGAKFQRFAQTVAGDATGDKAAALRRDMTSFVGELAARKKRNEPPYPPGHGRIDALGNILNEVLVEDLGVPANRRAPDAPVSYPVLWDAHQHDFVQWNGAAPNAGPGPLLRNIGEVLGVFGHMTMTPRKGRLPVYKDTSVDVENLKAIEVLVAKLQSPTWPKTFPAVDAAQVKAGEAVYAKQCVSCHALIKRDDPNRRIQAHMVDVTQVGTDPKAAVNFIGRTAGTGVLKGTPIFVDVLQTFGETAPAGDILRNAVFGVQLGRFELGMPHLAPIPRPSGGLLSLMESDWQGLERAVESKAEAIKTLVGHPKQLTSAMYKARPLNGVWASAPYLHNGSVPTLAELLKRPDQRGKRFYVGSRQFDPVGVGFRTVETPGSGEFAFDTTVPGNSNAGHPYGTQLGNAEKRQLIEYLKTL